MPAMPPAPDYVPYAKLRGRPNIIVDGAPLKSTVLTLSHWPNNVTPPELLRDTSTETVFAYLAAPEFHVTVPAVSNNHFDEDGLFSMFALREPVMALRYRDLLVDASRAGDFGIFRQRDAARLCFAIEACADPATSPLDPKTFEVCERERVVRLYRQMLERLPDLIEQLPAHQALWSVQDAHLDESLSLVGQGQVAIEEIPSGDIAVVRIPAGLPARRLRRYLAPEQGAVHPFAIHQATDCNRILRIQGARYELQYRYESWVQLASRRPALRVSLEPLAERLNQIESAPGTWRGEPVTEVAPRLYLDGADGSRISAEEFIRLVCDYLASAPVAWDPYDWQPQAVELQG